MIRTPLAYFATYIIWGSTFLGIAIAVDHMEPLPMTASRFLLAGILVAAAVGIREARSHWGRPARPSFGAPAAATRSRLASRTQMPVWQIVVTGALFTLGTHGIVSHISRDVASGVIAVVMATVPVFAATMGWMLGHERPGPVLFGALGLGIIGVAVLAWPTGAIGDALGPAQAIWLLAAALCWAAGSVLTKQWSQGRDTLSMAAGQMLSGGLLLLMAGGVAGQGWIPSWPGWTGALAIVYIAVGGTIAAYFSYLYLMARTTVTKASSYTFVNPVVAVILGAAIASEPLTPRLLVATPLIVLTVVLTLRSKSRPRPLTPSPPALAPRSGGDRRKTHRGHDAWRQTGAAPSRLASCPSPLLSAHTAALPACPASTTDPHRPAPLDASITRDR